MMLLIPFLTLGIMLLLAFMYWITEKISDYKERKYEESEEAEDEEVLFSINQIINNTLDKRNDQ